MQQYEDKKQIKVIHGDYKTIIEDLKKNQALKRAFLISSPDISERKCLEVLKEADETFKDKLDHVQICFFMRSKGDSFVYVRLQDKTVTHNLLIIEDILKYSSVIAQGLPEGCSV